VIGSNLIAILAVCRPLSNVSLVRNVNTKDLHRTPEYSEELCHYATHQQTVFMIASECHEFKTKQCNSRTETTPVSASHAIRPSWSKACPTVAPSNMAMALVTRHDGTVTQYVHTQTNKLVLRIPASAYKYSDLVTKAMEILKGESDPPDTGCCSHIHVHIAGDG